jgi:hypothetical protein
MISPYPFFSTIFKAFRRQLKTPLRVDGDDLVLFLVAEVLDDYEGMLRDRRMDINCRNPPVRQLHGDVQEDGPLEAILRDQVRQRDGVKVFFNPKLAVKGVLEGIVGNGMRVRGSTAARQPL